MFTKINTVLLLAALSASSTIAAAAAVNPTKDFYYNENFYSRRGYTLISDAYQRGLSGDIVSFAKFDVSGFVSEGFSAANGDKAYLTLQKYQNTGSFALRQSTAARPSLVGVSGLNSRDAGAILGGLSGEDAIRNDFGSGPSGTPVVDEGYVGAAGLYSWDVTDLVQQWVNNASSNFGLALHARNDASPNAANPNYIYHSYFVSSDGPDLGHVASGYVAANAFKPLLSDYVPAGSSLVAVPEPTSIAALALGGVSLLRRRRVN